MAPKKGSLNKRSTYMADKLNKQLAEYAQEQNTHVTVAKALDFTHSLARMKNVSMDAVIKAMDTQESGAGADWIMTGFSPDIVQEVALERKVSSLFDRIRMPGNPYKFPVEGGDPTAYITAENTADSGQTSVKFSNAGTAGTTFTAKKISVAIRTSDELEQDSIADVAPYVNRKVLAGLVNGEENALINGDTAGSHMDSDVTGADDVRKAFKGLRALTNSGAKVDGGSGTLTSAVRSLRTKMGKYAVDPSKLALVVGIAAYYRLMEEGSVITLDKFGPAATILTGELGKFDGIPVIVSAYVREDLNASGVYDGSTTTKTIALLAHRGSFAIGDRQQVELEADREAIYGQDILIGRERLDFQKWYAASENPVGMIYNIAKP